MVPQLATLQHRDLPPPLRGVVGVLSPISVRILGVGGSPFPATLSIDAIWSRDHTMGREGPGTGITFTVYMYMYLI